MKIFTVLDGKVRTDFEKKWQIPYGYASTHAYLFFSLQGAVDFVNNISKKHRDDLVIEQHENGVATIVY